MSKQNEHYNTPQTLYEWAGGLEVIQKLIIKFYDKVVKDDVLKPIFQHMSTAQ